MTKIIPNLDDSLFRIDLPTRSPSAGVLLVAEPFLREEYFNHAVITDRKSTRLNSSHPSRSRMPSSA